MFFFRLRLFCGVQSALEWGWRPPITQFVWLAARKRLLQRWQRSVNCNFRLPFHIRLFFAANFSKEKKRVFLLLKFANWFRALNLSFFLACFIGIAINSLFGLKLKCLTKEFAHTKKASSKQRFDPLKDPKLNLQMNAHLLQTHSEIEKPTLRASSNNLFQREFNHGKRYNDKDFGFGVMNGADLGDFSGNLNQIDDFFES